MDSELYHRLFGSSYFKVILADSSEGWRWTAYCGSIFMSHTACFKTKEECKKDFDRIAKINCLCYETIIKELSPESVIGNRDLDDGC